MKTLSQIVRHQGRRGGTTDRKVEWDSLGRGSYSRTVLQGQGPRQRCLGFDRSSQTTWRGRRGRADVVQEEEMKTGNRSLSGAHSHGENMMAA